MRNIFKSIEEITPTGLKLLIGGFVVASVAISTLILSSEEKDITASTVMITSLNERGGGTGVVIGISESLRTILTNKHVCELTLKGGLVKTNDGGRYLVTGVSAHSEHDLCLITVASRLKAKATIAKNAPKMFKGATVSGHPSLLPNVLTQGHFSGKKIIDVFKGVRDCTTEELEDPIGAAICMFFNGMPSIQTSESILVTATIMPGSSGSAVYNEDKELSALVFAGQGELGYAFAVPFEYIEAFLLETPKYISPKYETSMIEQASASKSLKNKCKNLDKTELTSKSKEKVTKICKIIVRDVEWRTVNEISNVNN